MPPTHNELPMVMEIEAQTMFFSSHIQPHPPLSYTHTHSLPVSRSGTETKALPSSFYGPPGDKTVPVVLAFTGPYSILTLESVNSVHTIMVLEKKKK